MAGNLNKLNSLLDQFVTQYGPEKASQILELWLNWQSADEAHLRRQKLALRYLIMQAVFLFDVNEQDFFNNTDSEYLDARMTCFYLLSTHFNYSYERIAAVFNTTRRSVKHYMGKMREILPIPQYHKTYMVKHNALERKMLEFMLNMEK